MAGRSVTTTSSSHPLSDLIAQPTSLVSSITILLQTLNPQNPDPPHPHPSPLAQFAPHLNPHLVTQVIKTLKNPNHALYFFNWASNPDPNPTNYAHGHFAYIAITDLLISRGHFSAATRLLESSDKLSDFMVGKFIKAHGDRGHLRSAIHLFYRVRRKEMGRCLFSFNAILGVLVRESRLGLAQAIWGQSVKEGVMKPDVSSYTILIKGLCRMGMVEDAQKVFDRMVCNPNSITFNTMINGFVKKGLMEDARRVFDVMMGTDGCLPDTVTYTTLIDGYCKNGEIDEAKRCFNEMVRQNCEPNALTYNALIYGLCLRGDVDEAKRMMTRMRLNGLKDNVATHTSLLKGYCIVGRSDEAVRHLGEMVRIGMEPDVKSYGVVVNGCCKVKKPDEAIGLLSEMRGRGIRPNVFCFNAVIRVLVDLGELDRAILLLKQMPPSGCYPNFVSYNTVISGLVRTRGRMREVEELVSDMFRNGHDLDTTLYSFLVQGYCNDGNMETAMQVFLEMIQKGLVLDVHIFSVFVKELSVRGKVFEVERIFERMSSCHVIDVDSYKRVLDSCLITSFE
ncbi:hypothetical protein RJ640_018788 [Escallonia rubra]|uniref:Pentatricopeptide repeat-containing protein n=1 Tax=Escallonia rubra TaxID=112253 RepID=A0AA88S8H5_9ASTE|nr:hypothetical protein RJ640_018788 [Escallonia rubra]